MEKKDLPAGDIGVQVTARAWVARFGVVHGPKFVESTVQAATSLPLLQLPIDPGITKLVIDAGKGEGIGFKIIPDAAPSCLQIILA